MLVEQHQTTEIWNNLRMARIGRSGSSQNARSRSLSPTPLGVHVGQAPSVASSHRHEAGTGDYTWTRMPNSEKQVTDSWIAHEEFLRATKRFLAEIRIDDGEVWIGEVCFGSPNQPGIRSPLRRDSGDLVGRSVNHAEALAADVKETLQRALQITRDRVRKLQADGAVDEADLAGVIDRSQALERLLEELTSAAPPSSLAWHPASLSRWYEILRASFVPGNPAVEVRVVTTYVL